MRDGFVEDFILYAQTSLSPSNTKKIQCLLQEIRTNLSERNHKIVYKHEGIWTCKGLVGKL
jgi:hypothetical protein